MYLYPRLTSSVYLLDGAVVGSVNCYRVTENKGKSWNSRESFLKDLPSRSPER